MHKKNNNMTVIPLYLLSAMLSNSSDEELCAQCSAEVSLPTNAPRPGNTMKADYSAQGSLMCFIWMRWKRRLCSLAVAQPAVLGSREEGKGLTGSGSHPACLCSGSRRKKRYPAALGPPKNWAHTDQTKAEGLQAGLSPDCLSRYLRVYWGAGSVLSLPTVGTPACDAAPVILICRTL